MTTFSGTLLIYRAHKESRTVEHCTNKTY